MASPDPLNSFHAPPPALTPLPTDAPDDAPVPPAHSFKFASELQRVCGARERVNPILLHNTALDAWTDAIGLTAEEKRLQLVSKVLCFLARHTDARFLQDDDASDGEEESDDGSN